MGEMFVGGLNHEVEKVCGGLDDHLLAPRSDGSNVHVMHMPVNKKCVWGVQLFSAKKNPPESAG
jgi:hypothetical protein